MKRDFESIEFIHGEYLSKPNGDIVAITHKSEDTDREEVKRYAALFAAAPEMLKLLEESIPYVEESEQFNKPTMRKLSAKIKKLVAQFHHD